MSPVLHGHHAEVSASTPAITGPAEMQLPGFSVVYLQAERSERHLPIGTVLPSFIASAPRGWISISASADPRAGGKALNGAFLIGRKILGPGVFTDAPIEHKHSIAHQHTVTVSPPIESSNETAIQGVAPPIALSDHTHPTVIQYDGDSQSTSHLPPFVGLNLILKIQ